MIYTKSLNYKYETDVFVAGGGPSGVAAAVAAARSGKKVFLAEATGCFGGLGTSGLVPAFAPFDDGENVLVSGIGYEIRQRLTRSTPLRNWTTLDIEELKREYDKIIEESGIDYSFFTTVYDVIVDNGKVEGVILGSKSGLFAVKAKIYIDCTGDGDLCAFGGADYEMGDENGSVMPQTLAVSGLISKKKNAMSHGTNMLNRLTVTVFFLMKTDIYPASFIGKTVLAAAILVIHSA